MRIGPFDIECAFNPCFVLAEVYNGQARLLRYLSVRNVRGQREDRMNLTAEVNGRRTRKKAVIGLGVSDEARAAELERGIRDALLVPRELGPGRYSGRLMIWSDFGEQEIPFDIEILKACVIPNDFARARLLACHVREEDALRAFAAQSTGENAKEDLRQIYNALLEKQLSYQPPVARAHPDCQRVSQMGYVLEHGGSCADLSLLLASLLWCRGHSPAILLFEDHMTAGVFINDNPPAFETLDSAPEIARMIDEGALILVEATALCSFRKQGYEASRRAILTRLCEERKACMLINVKRILRADGMSLLPTSTDVRACCPTCGYDRLTGNDLDRGICPSCGGILPTAAPAPTTPASSADPPPFVVPAPSQTLQPVGIVHRNTLQYGIRDGKPAVLRLLRIDESTVQVSETWQGRTVFAIWDRAMERSRVVLVLLPETITHIGDYAFCHCGQLSRIALPERLQTLGAGAFSGSGLCAIELPRGVRHIARMAFSDCAALERAELNDGLEAIGERAFANCPLLRTVRIPASVKRVGRGAFDPDCELILMSGSTVIER